MTAPNRPECHGCPEGTRAGRSLYCQDCRITRRRARKTETQRARRAAARRDPEIETLISDVRSTAKRLGEHLRRQEQRVAHRGEKLNSVQNDALKLIERALRLSDRMEKHIFRRN